MQRRYRYRFLDGEELITDRFVTSENLNAFTSIIKCYEATYPHPEFQITLPYPRLEVSMKTGTFTRTLEGPCE